MKALLTVEVYESVVIDAYELIQSYCYATNDGT